MNEHELTAEILSSFGFRPTADQLGAVECFSRFMFSTDNRAVMVLSGSAGTGKTSIASAMVRTMKRLSHNTVLLAPTGRAAKVFSINAGEEACTIHRRIYRQRSFEGVDTAFGLSYNRARNTLFIVDEASMISNQNGASGALFGSGCLLDDLVEFVYSGANCRLMLIGDKAQLPPVGLEESPALDAATLEAYGLHVARANMDEVLRQSQTSGILFNATAIRRIATAPGAIRLPRIRLHGFSDVGVITGDELIESLAGSYSKAGLDGTMVVTRSNKRANIYNQGIRNKILGREAELTIGDRLMVVKNNYFWTEKHEKDSTAGGDATDLRSPVPAFLANGDIAVVRKAKHFREVYGFRFADVTLSFPDYDDYETDLTVCLNALYSEAPALTHDEQQQLFARVALDYAHIPRKADRMKAIREDVYYNALQVKFAYAVTCHKAQGGQWEHVYIDQGYLPDAMINYDYIHWLYTAFTRAASRLFLVNWSGKQIEE